MPKKVDKLLKMAYLATFASQGDEEATGTRGSCVGEFSLF
jgi:hypothetical protein